MLALVLALAMQQPVAAASPVARIVVTPANPTVIAGDTIRLRAEAQDSAGRAVPNARIRWFGGLFGQSFEGRLGDTTGLVEGGSTGTLVVRAVATVPGARASRPAMVMVRIVPGPAERVAIEPNPTRLLVGQRLSLRAAAYSAAGDRRDDEIRWTSSAPGVVRIQPDGRIAALVPGRATITATAGAASATLAVSVVPSTVRRLEITGGAPEARTGDVLRFRVAARDAAGREVADMTPLWTLAPGNGQIESDGTFVANEAGDYTVAASFGTASAETTVRVRHRETRRPTTTVGRLPLTRLPTAEFWPHPNGRNAYLSTIGDRVYALDITDPANPRVTDSIIVDARTINDVMTTADGRFGVLTREGASSRRNGIVVLSFEDPAHPRPIAEYTETVTGGVHSTYIYTQPRYGTHVYLTDDATGSMRVIDLNDPAHPHEVARWQTNRSDAGRTLHDIDVLDGLAYLSYWNDGLVILDVGSGIRGGSPTNPQLVSQLKYDLNDLYRNVEAEGGPGFIRGTHTAWRHRARDLVFIADEVFSAKPQGVLMPGLGLGKANGRLQVIDVSDVTRPRSVAWYEPADGGTHNVWVAGDTLYLGDYQGGLRVLDVSG
ncbi:MAG: Ig-like domain-containing protein, partial [Gemmatimonadetes bacterium]|nr:Ig-like domain-containing protein [Gemmatimonadota bacterium]